MIHRPNSLAKVADPSTWPVGGVLAISNRAITGKIHSLDLPYLLEDTT